MTCKDGFYLTVYSHVDALCHAYSIPMRHDQNMALWEKTGDRVTLLKYWEFERFSGQKHHSLSFASLEQALTLIDTLLKEIGVKRSDLQAILGTPGLSMNDEDWGRFAEFNRHTLAHLFGAMLAETEHFFESDMIGLALDGGPDIVLDQQHADAPIYAGAVSRKGTTKIFPVPSPGPFWSAMRELTGLEEGSLMALGSASKAEYFGPVEEAPRVFKTKDYADAYNWVKKTFEIVTAIEEAKDYKIQHRFDSRFSALENRIAMLVKIVQEASDRQLQQTLKNIINDEKLNPETLTLAISGGFALNCRSNSRVVQELGFARFQSIPCVNDSGISLGYGLMFFLDKMKRFDFSLGGAGKGAFASERKAGLALATDEILNDLACGPIIWMEGGAEIGPRALGHRSLLADPRSSASKDRLNEIKRRQWWRPVAPVILEEHAEDWFEASDRSPFMLRTFLLRTEKADLVPAISHLDRSARVQTLDCYEAPLLHALLTAFLADTGVPILCNTSLNDKGEPIINTLEEALIFAKRRGVSVVYVDGVRHPVIPDAILDSTPLSGRTFSPLFQSSSEDIGAICAAANPHGLSRTLVALHKFVPAFNSLDITHQASAERLQRHGSRLKKNRAMYWSLIK